MTRFEQRISDNDVAAARHLFIREPPDGESVFIGTWSSADLDQSPTVTLEVHSMEESETAERWRSELSAGRLPESSEEAS